MPHTHIVCVVALLSSCMLAAPPCTSDLALLPSRLVPPFVETRWPVPLACGTIAFCCVRWEVPPLEMLV
jgi:hypothetical protein